MSMGMIARLMGGTVAAIAALGLAVSAQAQEKKIKIGVVYDLTGPLAGGGPLTAGIDTPKTIGNFYGYATTVFDFTRRSMPFNMPLSLTNDEAYALTAYILALNKIIGENDVMDAKTLPQVKMPNRDNFIIRFPDRI